MIATRSSTKRQRLPDVLSLGDMIRNGDEDGACDLIDRCPECVNDLDGDEDFPQTPLMIAAGCGNNKVVRHLLSRNANVEFAINGRTALSEAADMGYSETVRILVMEGGAKVDSEVQGEKEKVTPMISALEQGEEVSVGVLIDLGANVKHKVKGSQCTALMVAAEMGLEASVMILLREGASVKDSDSEGRTALHWAVAGNAPDFALARRLLQAGADWKARTTKNETVLHYCIRFNQTGYFEQICQHLAGIQLNKGLLHYACSLPGKAVEEATLAFLLDVRNEDVNGVRKTGSGARSCAMTPLCRLIRGFSTMYYGGSDGRHRLSLCRFLVSQGARVFHDGDYPNSPAPLVHAAAHGPVALLEVLLENSPYAGNQNPTLGSVDSLPLRDPLRAAVRKGRIDIVEFLLSRGADVKGAPYLWECVSKTEFKRIDMMRFLVEQGADVNMVCDGETPLIAAIRQERQNVEMMRLLIEKGADVNMVCDGETPLIAAIRHERKHVVKELLDAETMPDLEPANKGGETPLWVALQTGNVDIIFMILIADPAELDRLTQPSTQQAAT